MQVTMITAKQSARNSSECDGRSRLSGCTSHVNYKSRASAFSRNVSGNRGQGAVRVNDVAHVARVRVCSIRRTQP